MKKYISIILVFLVVLSFTSCEDVIEVKLSDEQTDLYAVEATITTQDNPTVFLYKTIHVDQDVEFPGVSGATVVISDNSNPSQEIELVESSEQAGYYVVPEGEDYIGQVGKEYTLTIETNGVTLTATEQIYRVEPIDSIQVHSSLRGDHRFLGVFTYGAETPGEGDYYKWDIYINNNLLYESEYLIVTSDELVDGNYVAGFEIFTDFHDTNEPEERIINLGDSVYVNQTSISSFAYNYYYQMFDQGQTGGLFSVPPANIHGNFTSNDDKPVLGIFTARDISTSNTITIDDAIESQLRKD